MPHEMTNLPLSNDPIRLGGIHLPQSENKPKPLPTAPQTQKTNEIEHQILGGVDKPVKVVHIDRSKIHTASNLVAPKPSFFRRIRASASRFIDYIKNKFSRKENHVTVSRPPDVIKSSLEQKLLAQLTAVEHNEYFPNTEARSLDPNLPQTAIELKNLITELAKSKDEMKQDLNPLQKSVDTLVPSHGENELKDAIANLENEPNLLQKSVDTLVPSHGENELKDAIANLENEPNLLQKSASQLPKILKGAALTNRIKELAERSKGLLESLKEKKAALAAKGEIQSLDNEINKLEVEFDLLYENGDYDPESLLKLRSAINQLKDRKTALQAPENRIRVNNQKLMELEKTNGNELEVLKFKATVKELQNEIKADQAAATLVEDKIKNLAAQIDNLEAKLDSLYVSENSTPEALIKLQKAINQLKDRKTALQAPETRIRVNNEKLMKLKTVRENEIKHFKDAISFQEEELVKTLLDLKNLPPLPLKEEYSDHQTYLDERVNQIVQEDELIIKKEELERSIAENYTVLTDIIEELKVLNPEATSVKTPSIGMLKDLEALVQLNEDLSTVTSLISLYEKNSMHLEHIDLPKLKRKKEKQENNPVEQIKTITELERTNIELNKNKTIINKLKKKQEILKEQILKAPNFRQGLGSDEVPTIRQMQIAELPKAPKMPPLPNAPLTFTVPKDITEEENRIAFEKELARLSEFEPSLESDEDYENRITQEVGLNDELTDDSYIEKDKQIIEDLLSKTKYETIQGYIEARRDGGKSVGKYVKISRAKFPQLSHSYHVSDDGKFVPELHKTRQSANQAADPGKIQLGEGGFKTAKRLGEGLITSTIRDTENYRETNPHGIEASHKKEFLESKYLLVGDYTENKSSQTKKMKGRFIMQEMDVGDIFDLAGSGSLNEKEAAHILLQAAQGIKVVHDNHWIHRDIKLENIFYNSKGEAKLADFDIAMPVNEDSTVIEQIGSPGYISPELARGQLHGLKEGQQNDIFGFGITILRTAGLDPYSDFLDRNPDIAKLNEVERFSHFDEYMKDEGPEGFSRKIEDICAEFIEMYPEKTELIQIAFSMVIPAAEGRIDIDEVIPALEQLIEVDSEAVSLQEPMDWEAFMHAQLSTPSLKDRVTTVYPSESLDFEDIDVSEEDESSIE